MARGGVFHLWGHSWEIEEQDQLGKPRKFLDDCVPVARRVKKALPIRSSARMPFKSGGKLTTSFAVRMTERRWLRAQMGSTARNDVTALTPSLSPNILELFLRGR